MYTILHFFKILQCKKEAGTKPPSQTKEGLEFEFFLKFQSFYFA